VDVLLPRRVDRGVDRVGGGRVGEGNRVDGWMTPELAGEPGESKSEYGQLEFEARGLLSPQVVLRPPIPQYTPEVLRRRAVPEDVDDGAGVGVFGAVRNVLRGTKSL
jgi:hypothetical protein